ncbi:MAG: hypothetical protein KC561_11465, partial [Myxococcales bacterium]|nr:hypothetical protein [Myxococcales bacterium]
MNASQQNSSTAARFEPLDLTGSRQIINQSFPSLGLVEERMANRLAMEFTRTIQSSVEVTVKESAIAKAHQYMGALESPGCANQLYFEALGGQGLLMIQNSVLFLFLEGLFGGSNIPVRMDKEPPERSRFSSVEERVVRRIVHLFGRAMEHAWRPLLPLTVRHLRVETKPSNIPIAEPGDSLV